MTFSRLLTALFLTSLISSCSSIAKQIIQEPKVSLQGVKVKDLKSTGGIVVIAVEVDNPNAFGLTLDDLTYELEIGGVPLSKGQLKDGAKVGANTKTVVEIPVPLKFEELFSSALDFVTKKASAYRVKGEARFGLITLPFDKVGEMKLK